jgi:hypothetical protein
MLGALIGKHGSAPTHHDLVQILYGKVGDTGLERDDTLIRRPFSLRTTRTLQRVCCVAVGC